MSHSIDKKKISFGRVRGYTYKGSMTRKRLRTYDLNDGRDVSQGRADCRVQIINDWTAQKNVYKMNDASIVSPTQRSCDRFSIEQE